MPVAAAHFHLVRADALEAAQARETDGGAAPEIGAALAGSD